MDLLLGKRKNESYEIASSMIDDLYVKINDTVRSNEVPQNVWQKIIPGQKNSPSIMGMGKNTHLLYFPKNSVPYKKSNLTSKKNIYVVDGCVYDKKTSQKFVKGCKYIIEKNTEIEPYTLDCEAYVFVTPA